LKRRSNCLWHCLTVALIALVSPLRADTSSSTPPQAFVKVNQFYLLYTYPVVPYVDRSGTLMVGLEGFARSLFAKAPVGDPQAKFYGGDDYGRVTTDAAARTETLTAGSATVQVDGASVTMEAAAVWNTATGQMVVPAASLARCLGLACAWNPVQRLLTVTAPDAMTSGDMSDGGGAYSASQSAPLVPWRVAVRAAPPPPGTVYPIGPGGGSWRRVYAAQPWLMYEARNVSSAAVYSEELNVVVLFTNNAISGDLDSVSGFRSYGPSPAIPDGGVRQLSVSLQSNPNIHLFPLCVVSYPQALVTSLPIDPVTHR
jgi:hypothetical protein